MANEQSEPLPTDSSPLLSIEALAKTYGTVRAVDQLSIAVRRGEMFGLLGPSGCGKTTTLRLILGLEKPDGGLIEFAGKDITAVPPEARGFGMVFQNYALFTSMNVFENVAFGLDATNAATPIRKQVESLLTLVRLPLDYAAKKVDQLSAGEQQRVAIARALAIKPPLLLLDEPLANLDAELRRHTGGEIRAMIKRLNIAAVCVTHDLSEAFTLCDRIAVMNNGRILQTGSPFDIYEHPSQLSVARFLGFNILPARRAATINDELGEFEIVGGGWRLHARECLDTARPECDRFVIAIRPEDIHVGMEERGTGNPLRATIRQLIFAGPITRVTLDVGEVALETFVMRDSGFSAGAGCVIEIPPSRALVFPLTE